MVKILHLIFFVFSLESDAVAQRMYDGNGRLIGRIDSERFYDGSGHQIGRIDGQRIYDGSGRQLGRIEGEDLEHPQRCSIHGYAVLHFALESAIFNLVA